MKIELDWEDKQVLQDIKTILSNITANTGSMEIVNLTTAINNLTECLNKVDRVAAALKQEGYESKR
jgi:hypothetical protein